MSRRRPPPHPSDSRESPSARTLAVDERQRAADRSEWRFAREAGFLGRVLEVSDDAEDPCALEGVGEDLQTADLLLPAIAPDVHNRQALGPFALG